MTLPLHDQRRHPLNLPPELVLHGTPDDIRNALRWRTSAHPNSQTMGSVFELWKVPVVQLMDFYPVTGTCWPMAVLGPGIGSLLAMNILLVSHLTMSWGSTTGHRGCSRGLRGETSTPHSRSENNPAIIKINSAGNQTIQQIVGFFPAGDRRESA